ncbi:MAG: 4-hydroxy-tetrahydrodipicolinate reductase [Alphaproteobacteria bacterium]|nr:4-hydroxy-tetrahydrodipicolinate reductase [Alphaproteobacteria bacterium]
MPEHQISSPLRVGILGFGRMGQSIYDILADPSPTFCCAGIFTRSVERYQDHPASHLIHTDIDKVVVASDILIDVTTADAVTYHIDAAVRFQKPLLICVTGIDDTHKAAIEKAAVYIPLCLAPNTSPAMTILASLVERAVGLLDDIYDIEIFEAHHRDKADAPSGTALMLGEAAARGCGVPLNEAKLYPHEGKRKKGSIGFSVARGGAITGEHTVYLYGDDDVLSFTHRSLNRTLFAKGAIKLARLVHQKTPGLYHPHDLFTD